MQTPSPARADACTAAFNGNTHAPIDHRPLMSLGAIMDALSGVEGAIAGLLELLDAAGSARVYASGIDALLDPVHLRLVEACEGLLDLPLIERSEYMRPMAPGEVLLQAPQKLTYKFFTTCGAFALCIEGEGFTQTLCRFHVPLNSDVRHWNLGHWLSTEERTDHLGQRWTTHRTYITDDFGQLVALEGGAA